MFSWDASYFFIMGTCFYWHNHTILVEMRHLGLLWPFSIYGSHFWLYNLTPLWVFCTFFLFFFLRDKTLLAYYGLRWRFCPSLLTVQYNGMSFLYPIEYDASDKLNQWHPPLSGKRETWNHFPVGFMSENFKFQIAIQTIHPSLQTNTIKDVNL